MSNLPELVMSPKLQTNFNRLYLDFLTSVYLADRYRSSEDVRFWFLKEIAYYLTICYPEKNKKDIEEILIHIVKMAESTLEKK